MMLSFKSLTLAGIVASLGGDALQLKPTGASVDLQNTMMNDQGRHFFFKKNFKNFVVKNDYT